jgi:NTE family protein
LCWRINTVLACCVLLGAVQHAPAQAAGTPPVIATPAPATNGTANAPAIPATAGAIPNSQPPANPASPQSTSRSAAPATTPVPANPPAVPGRPRLGLVLEGGGALGLAHIGVLQWMEEHHIPVSYVAGTSMGGLVGGFYATGLSAAEVRENVSRIDWDAVLAGQTPFHDLSFRRKEDEHDYPSSLEFGLHKGLQFPAGFNSGQQVSLILDRVALPYSELPNFNDLPIPFACVGTDLVSGKQYVFRSGDLSFALRSTMSLPGLFSPMRDGTHIFADGGLLNNIPIDVAKSMGADVVLGIHLEVAPINPDDQMSSFGVLGRSISVMIASNELRSLEQADLLVTVPLQKYTAVDYDKADEIIKAGYDAAAAKATVLSAYTVTVPEWQAYIAERESRRRTVPIPQFIQVVSPDPKANRAIEKQAAGLVGKPIDTEQLNQSIMDLQGLGQYSTLNYSMIDKGGQQGLEIQAIPKSYAPPIVRPLILIDGSDFNDVLFSIGARITFFDFGNYRSELRNDIVLGSNYGFASEYFHPITPTSNFFIAPRVGFSSTPFNVYSDSDLIATYRQRLAGGGFDAGYEFGRSAELRLGYEGGYERYSKVVGSATQIPVVSGVTGDTRLRFELNELDDSVIPRAGQYAKFDVKFYNLNPDASSWFPSSEGQIEKFFHLDDPTSIFVIASGGTSYGYKTGIPLYSLGGSLRLVAYGTNELLTDQYYLGQFGYLRRLVKLPPILGDSVNVVGLFEVGKTFQLPGSPSPPRIPGDFAGGLIVNTIFGPVEVAGTLGNYGRARFFFRIGRIF